MMSLQSRPKRQGGIIVLTLAAMVALAVPHLGPLPQVAQAEFYIADNSTELRLGQVTDKRRDAIYINQMAYEFTQDILMMDDEDRPRDLKDFEAGAEVKFRLRHGRLALLVLVLPR